MDRADAVADAGTMKLLQIEPWFKFSLDYLRVNTQRVVPNRLQLQLKSSSGQN